MPSMDARRLALTVSAVAVLAAIAFYFLMPRARITATATRLAPASAPSEYEAYITTNAYTESVTVNCEVGDPQLGTDSFSLSIAGGDETVGYHGELHGGDGATSQSADVPITCSAVAD